MTDNPDRLALEPTEAMTPEQHIEFWYEKWEKTFDELGQQINATNGAYRERAQLVALLAAIYPATWNHGDTSTPDWPVVYVNLPTGQASWHISPDDWHLFAHVPYDVATEWDGHTTEEKYQRIAVLTSPYDPTSDKLSERFRKRRVELGLSIREVEAATGVPQIILSRLENGKTEMYRGNARRVQHWLWRTGIAEAADR